MSDIFVDKIQAGNTEYKIKDSALTETVSTLSSKVDTEDAKRPEQKCFSDITVETTDWIDQSSDPDYEDFPYRATVATAGVTADYSPDVRFDLNEAVSGIFAPIAVSDSNVVYIYANEVPVSDITIPVIICTKVGV